MVKWLIGIFKGKPDPFDSFLKELVKERKDAINVKQRGTIDTGPR